MSKPSSIEDRLRQLVPSSLSEDGIQRMDKMIESLSQADTVGTEGDRSRIWRGLWRVAAIVLLLVVPAAIYHTQRKGSGPSVVDSAIVAYEAPLPDQAQLCLLYTSPSPRDATLSRMPSSA